MLNTQEFHVSLYDLDYQVTRFVAESSTMSNVYAASINLMEINKNQFSSDEYWVDVRDTEGKYIIRVKYENKGFHVGFLLKNSVDIEWYLLDEHQIMNPEYQFKRIIPPLIPPLL